MTRLAPSYQALNWAAKRLTEAHRDPELPATAFQEVLDTYLIATRAYHQAIRDENERLTLDTHRIASRTDQANN